MTGLVTASLEPMPTTKDILPARYRSPERVAEGGMGEIYRATDESLGREVAIKILAERYAQDEPLRRRFTREALAAARLSGEPHTVTIFDVGEHAERPFIVMEYLAGGSLDDRLRAGRIPTGQALDWLEDAATALDAAHEHGVVHRDVKPANLLLDGSGRLHVADFGIASATGMDSLTKAGTVMGTAGYLSPEQALGEKAGAASDRYALGVVAFELLTGSRPFARPSTTAEATAHVNDPVPSVCEARDDVPCELDPVFARALAKRPDDRYGSSREFVAELRAAMDEAAGKTRIGALPPATAATRPVRERPVHRSSNLRLDRTPLLVGLLAAAIAAGGVALAVALTSGGEPAATPRTVIRTVTTQGESTVKTVTEQAPTTAPSAPSEQSGTSLNDAGFARMRARDYAGALPLLEQAVQKLQGTGSTPEAYADYNLALTRYALGNCDGVVDLLNASEAIQGRRKEISRLRKDAERHCQPR